MNTWERVAYTVQLLAACLLCMKPLRKREHYLLRVVFSLSLLLFLTYVLNGMIYEETLGAGRFVYWFGFLLICIPFIGFCSSVSVKEAVYCTVVASAMQHFAYDIYYLYLLHNGKQYAVFVLLYILTYAGIYFLFVRKLSVDGGYEVSRSDLIPLITIVLLVWFLSVWNGRFLVPVGNLRTYAVTYQICDAICCLYVLWVQVNQREKLGLQKELDGIEAAWHRQKNQYEVTQQTIDSINRKCHDLKHQIRSLRNTENTAEKNEYFDEIEHAIMIYDTALKTNNRALDAVMMEKGLFCRDHQIQLTCMADGSRLDFMKPEDIYAIFGNALDNSIRAVLELEDPGQRIITVKVITQKDIMVIQIQNYYKGTIRFRNGFPLTTKQNKEDHGFGIKSIQYTAEKYNGTMTAQGKDGIFTLQILLPFQFPKIS